MKRSRAIALTATAACAIAIVLLLLGVHLTFDPATLRQPPRPMTEVATIEEEYVDFLDQAHTPSDPAPARSDEALRAESHAAETSGADLADAGNAAPAPVEKTSSRLSPVKKPEKKPRPAGPTKEQQAEEEARRRARKGVADAFSTDEKADNNTDARGKTKGDSGTPDGTDSAVDGSGTGSVGGGWIMPKYAKVASALTGRVELRAIVGRDGQVISVEQTGGKAPAGSDPAVVARCIAEVKRRRFTRRDAAAPDRATATIIYTFR